MKVLVINCGSSTLKFQLIEMGGGSSSPSNLEQRLAWGIVDRIGKCGNIEFNSEQGESFREVREVADHSQATRLVLTWLDSADVYSPDGLGAVGHRVVHGGDQFAEPTLIDSRVMEAIEAVSNLAPLHNQPSLVAIREARSVLGPAVPMVATFDTAFHRTLPERASRYAIPHQLAAKHQVKRYGFHGLAHRYMMERYAAMTATPLEEAKLITLQLGNGCSATAIEGGRSVDTSMGFTPLEGLIMGTRSGDVDPTLAGFLSRQEQVNIATAEDWLNTRAGLLGVSGRSKDMRELLEAEREGDELASLAVEMFCYRVRKYIGAYLAALGGVDGIIFGGGIGENAPEVRTRILAGMEWCGLKLDERRNQEAKGLEGRITADDATLHAYVVLVNEALVIARDTVWCLRHCQP